MLFGVYNATRFNSEDPKKDPNGVLFAHIDLRYLMNSTLRGSTKEKTTRFNLVPLKYPQEPVEFDKSIRCPKPQIAHDHSKHTTNVIM